mgnify:CR=1 FL=1
MNMSVRLQYLSYQRGDLVHAKVDKFWVPARVIEVAANYVMIDVGDAKRKVPLEDVRLS